MLPDKTLVKCAGALVLAWGGHALALDDSPQQAVLEALLRHVVRGAQSHAPGKVYCVTGYDASLVPVIRSRVSADIPNIADGSACPKQTLGSRETAYVSIWLGPAVRISETEFTARAEIYRNPTNAESRIHTLRLSNGQWVVERSETNWVS